MALDLTDLAMLQLSQQAHLYDLTHMINRKDSSKRVEQFFHRMHKLLPLSHSLEIGAHEATYSQTVKKNYPHIHCRAFEANTLVYSHFLLNGILDTGVDYINSAIGDKDGTAPFHIYTKINNKKEDSDSRRQSLLKRVDTPPEASEVSAVYVPITRLDTITKNDPKNSLYSMWIDAEGATSMVLAGASETLKNTAIVYVEAESIPKFEGQIIDKELMQYFMNRDYMPILRDFQFLHQYNIIFVRKDLYTKIEHDLHNFLGYQKRSVLAEFFDIQGSSSEPVSITPPPLPKIEFKNVEELKKAIDALPLIRPSVDGLDPNKTVVACHAEHLEEAILFYKNKLKSLPAFYVLGDYSNIKVEKDVKLFDFAKLNNSLDIQLYFNPVYLLRDTTYPVLARELTILGINNFFIEKDCLKNIIWKESNFKPTDKDWTSILSFVNILKDAESKRIYMANIKALLEDNAGYLPRSGYAQYYHPNVSVEENDILCEGGLENGDTTLRFYNAMQNKGKIYGFEAFKPNWETLKNKFTSYKDNIVIEEQALWSSKGNIAITGETSGFAGVNLNSTEDLTPCISIDEYFKDKQAPTCIKLDVEGAEVEVIKGAINTLTKQKPKLLISIYHRQFGFDAITIPQILMDMNLDYDFYCGHHSSYYNETILYGIRRS